LIICFCFFFGCKNESSRNQTVPSGPKADQNKGNKETQPLITLTNEKVKSISFDTVKIQVPAETNITSENIYDGIYEWKRGSLIRQKVLTLNNLVFLTTFEDLGQGIRSNLYVYDLVRHSFIIDSSFNRDYLHSSAGVFVIDASDSKLFVIGKPVWYDAKKEIITAASFYNIEGKYFHFNKNIYKDGELGSDTTLADSSIISFYKNANTGTGVKVLPDGWWKSN
jgi:hypothetical protein